MRSTAAPFPDILLVVTRIEPDSLKVVALEVAVLVLARKVAVAAVVVLAAPALQVLLLAHRLPVKLPLTR